ncbi:MAG: hypothetical protein K2Z81_18700, partial [Cyanobacteria bacterium]|nr:hypothetical protein [Cyanobacteriota bacterium]
MLPQSRTRGSNRSKDQSSCEATDQDSAQSVNQCSTVTISPTSYKTSLFAHPRPESWWTGIPAHMPECPGRSVDGHLGSLPLPDLRTCRRQEVLDYFNNSWTLTELLFSSLVSEDAFLRPPYHGLRHPLVFYYVHPAVLYINKLRVAGIIDKALNSEFEALFETGVDEMSWDDMSKNHMEWPDLEKLHRYRKDVYNTIASIIQHHDGLSNGHPPITQKTPLWALFMGFEHERIHLETSSVLIRELPAHLVSRPEEWAPYHPGMDLENPTV